MERKERERRLRTFREAVENAGRMIYWMDNMELLSMPIQPSKHS